MSSIDNTVSALTSTDNTTEVTPMEQESTMTKSAYAQYCEKRGVIGIGIYVDANLIKAMDGAAAKAGIKRNEYMLTRLIAAVNADGFAYVAPEKARKESASQELARLRSEMAAIKAEREQQAKAQEELIAQNTPRIPTPPTLKANPETGKVEKAA